jgi:hypothetical protein
MIARNVGASVRIGTISARMTSLTLLEIWNPIQIRGKQQLALSRQSKTTRIAYNMINCLLFLSLYTAGLSSSALTRRNVTKLDGNLPEFTPSNFRFSGNVRRYYIAAEETEWDYAPTGWDNWLGVCGEDTLQSGYSRVDDCLTGSL